MESLGNGTLDVSVTKKFGQRVLKVLSDEESPSPSPTTTTTSTSSTISATKRFSPRLREIPDSKRPYYGPPRKQQTHPIQLLSSSSSSDDLEPLSSVVDGVLPPLPDEQEFSYLPHTRKDKALVKKALRIYNKYSLHFFQEQNDSRCRSPAKHQDVKKVDASFDRPDLKAISKMIECNEVLFPTKRFGHLPGIDVGYQFYSRAEMVAVGLHSNWHNDVDYKMIEEFKGYPFSIAIAIVLSSQYGDDQDNSEDIVYTSQGGNDFMGSKHQEISRGNLALKNNMEQSIPVRVIRGRTGDNHFKLYTYDGLYKVSKCWPAEGVSGSAVYKYHLKRLEGQPKLTSNQVQSSNGRSRVPAKAPNLVCLDISEGQEDVHIPAVNTIDDTIITGFTYTKYNQVLSNLKLPPNADGCKCKGGRCNNARICACARLNGGFSFPYVRRDGGRLIEAKDVVFECGPNCGCGPACINRISQQGIKYQLEVFRTSDRGWAVRTKDFIPSGAPVCEYIGELRRTNEVNNVAENDYIFEIDCWHTMKGIGGRERRLGDVSKSVSSKKDEEAEEEKEDSEAEFCIDAGRIGNVARFINHSCDPNLFVQCVLSSHHDVKLARILLFASDNIPPMEELTYDYGYALDSVVDSNGNVRTMACHCGTSECRKRLY